MQAGLAIGSGPGGAMPFLMQSVAVNDGSVEVSRTFLPSKAESDDGGAEEPATETYTIATRVFRPMSMASRQAAAVLVLHGGPSVPSDYLYPLVDFVPYRCMVYYDQIGCGRSTQPKDANA
jgi:pimeloyl-ACP methyl ester carboxylesterase